MQERESERTPGSALEALFARTDDPAIDYITDQLLDGGDFTAPPEPGLVQQPLTLVEAG